MKNEEMEHGICVGDVFSCSENARPSFRLVALEDGMAYTIGMTEANDKEVPKSMSFNDLREGVRTGRLKTVQDPFEALQEWREEPQALAEATERWETIEDFLGNPEHRTALLGRAGRREAIGELALELGLNQSATRRLLTRYWRRGMAPLSLVSGRKRGNPNEQVSKVRRGGAPSKAHEQSVAVGPAEREIFGKIYDDYLVGPKALSIEQAYLKMEDKYYTDKKTGETVPTVPTRRQFRYWVGKHMDRAKRKRAQIGDTVYENDFEPTYASSQGQTDGAGAVFELDASNLNVEICCEAEGEEVCVGTPLLFTAADVYTRMIAGYILTLEPESWRTAALTIMSCAQDKVELCSRYGIDIEPGDWPCRQLPAMFLADNGKCRSKNAVPLNRTYKTRVAFTAPYQGKDKPVVERSHEKFKDMLEGSLGAEVARLFPRRGKRLQGRLPVVTMDELNAIVIRGILKFNQLTIGGYPAPKGMAARKIPVTPLNLWRYSMEMGRTRLRNVSNMDTLRRILLPHEERTVREDGIHINNLRYSSPDPSVREAIYNSLKDGVEVFYDPLLVDEVYVPLGGGMVPLGLTDDFAEYAGMSLQEFEDLRALWREAEEEDLFRQDRVRIQTQRELEEAAGRSAALTKRASNQRGGRKKARRSAAIEEARRAEGSARGGAPAGESGGSAGPGQPADSGRSARQEEISSYVWDLMAELEPGEEDQ